MLGWSCSPPTGGAAALEPRWRPAERRPRGSDRASSWPLDAHGLRGGALVDRKQKGDHGLLGRGLGGTARRGDPNQPVRGLRAGAGQPNAVARPSGLTQRQRWLSTVPDAEYLIDAVVIAEAGHRVRWARADQLAGALAGRPRWTRIFLATGAWVIRAINFRRPPQRSQRSTSRAKTLLSREAQSMR